jgi:hypothetical protein
MIARRQLRSSALVIESATTHPSTSTHVYPMKGRALMPMRITGLAPALRSSEYAATALGKQVISHCLVDPSNQSIVRSNMLLVFQDLSMTL